MRKRLFLKSVTTVMAVAFTGVLILEIRSKPGGPGRSVLRTSEIQEQNDEIHEMHEIRGAARDTTTQKNTSHNDVAGRHRGQEPQKGPVYSDERSSSRGVATPKAVEGSDLPDSTPSVAEAEERMKHANPSLPRVPAGDVGNAVPSSTEVSGQPVSQTAPVKKRKRKRIR